MRERYPARAASDRPYRVSSGAIPCGCGGIGRRARFRSVWGTQIPVEVQVLSAAFVASQGPLRHLLVVSLGTRWYRDTNANQARCGWPGRRSQAIARCPGADRWIDGRHLPLRCGPADRAHRTNRAAGGRVRRARRDRQDSDRRRHRLRADRRWPAVTALALDTSVAIPLLVQTHRAHDAVVGWWNGREIALSGHAVAETYSVLT